MISSRRRRLQQLPIGFGGSVTSTQDRQSKVGLASAAYKDVVNNFGTTFAATSAAFDNLTEVNCNLGTNVATSVTNIQA